MRSLSLFVFTLVLLNTLFLGSTLAATIKVNPNTGEDSGTCGGVAKPCKSLSQAYTNASPGDAIHLYPATYKTALDKNLGAAKPDGNVVFSKSNIAVTTDPSVTVTGVPKAIVDLDGSGIFAEFEAVTGVTVTNLVIQNGAGDGSGSGGCMKFEARATVAVENVDFIRCQVPGNGFGSKGGTISIMNSSPTFKNCNFIESKSGVAGTIFVGGDSETNPLWENCLFKDGRCGEGGVGGVTIPETVGGSPTWKNCTFTGSRCPYGGTIDDGNESNNRFIDCLFEDSEAMNGGFFYGFAKGNTSFTNCQFRNSFAQNGGIAYMSTTATSTFVNCTVHNATGMDGGAVTTEDNGRSHWIDSTLTDVKSTSHGGVFMCSFNSGISVTNSVIDGFFVSTAGGFGYIDGSCQFNVTDTVIRNGVGSNGGGITVVSNSKVIVTNTTFKNVTGDSGGAFHVYPAHKGSVDVTKSTFDGCLAKKGGGAYVQSTDTNFKVVDSTFQGNEAEYGSAIYTDGPITIDNVDFIGNKAKKRYAFSLLEFDPSGTIYVRETSKIAQNPTSCDFLSGVLDIKNSKLNDNTVLGAGGAIFWETKREMFGVCDGAKIATDASLTYSNNTASGYGSFIATGPQKYTSSLVTSVYPGLPFSMKFKLVDSFNQQLGGSHTALILIVDNTATPDVAFSGATDPVGIVIDNGGEGTIEEMLAVGAPGSNFVLDVSPVSVLGKTEVATTIAQCPGGQNYNPSVKLCQPGCDEDYWSYAVGECSDEDITKDIAFFWKRTNPDGTPIGCYGGSPLPGKKSVECKYVPGESGMAVAFSVLAGIGIFVHLVAFATMFLKSDDKAIKAGQPIFNYLVILGDIICLCYVFISSGAPTDELCMSRPIIVSLGFTVSFVAMSIKAYRIDQIFNNNLVAEVKGLSTVVSYWGFAVVIDAVLFLVYGIVSPIEKTATVDIESFGPVSHFECRAGGDTFTVMVVAYKVFLLGIGSMYAWKTRNVSKQFSEAKPLFIVIYNTTLIGTIGCGLILSGQLGTQASMVLQSLAVFICTTANLVILIIPRILKAMGIIGVTEGDKDVFGKTTRYTAKTKKTEDAVKTTDDAGNDDQV